MNVRLKKVSLSGVLFSTVMPRWGKVGKQKIEDEGPLAPFPNMTGRQGWQEGRKTKYDMETFDEVLVRNTNGFMDKAKSDYGLEEAGMAQMETVSVRYFDTWMKSVKQS